MFRRSLGSVANDDALSPDLEAIDIVDARIENVGPVAGNFEQAVEENREIRVFLAPDPDVQAAADSLPDNFAAREVCQPVPVIPWVPATLALENLIPYTRGKAS